MTAPQQPSAPHGTATQYQQAQQDEWSRFVALVPIDFYGTRAYNPGDPVPVSAVEGDSAWIDLAWVAERSSGQVVESQTSPPPEPPTIDDSTVAAPPGSAAAPPPDESSTGDSNTITTSEG